MGNLECTFKVDYKTMLKSWDDVIPVVAALLNKVQDHHVKTFFELNKDQLPDDIYCRTVKEAREVLDGVEDV